MRKEFERDVDALRDVANRFDRGSNLRKFSLLREMGRRKIVFSGLLTTYYNTLLFIMAFPPDKKTSSLAEREVLRIARLLKRQPERIKELFVNSGIPFSKCRATFSHDFTRWLLSHPHATVSIRKIGNTVFDLNESLKVTLPSLERSETTAGFTNEELLSQLMPKRKLQLPYIINEISRLDGLPYIKDHYYDGLGIQTDVTPKGKMFSKAFNQIEVPSVFYHQELIRKVSVMEILNQKLPDEAVLSAAQKEQLIRVIRNAMAMTERETDPATYLKEESLRLFHLERGLSVALYGMTPERQLPMESYIGYTLFKNGYPAAYAGGWVFGWRSDYGLNIYDQFRGGESAYMVAQILRVYRQLFNIRYFRVEATQFGLDEPEGIATGVFWFYYKLGFRPVDPGIRKLANREYAKIRTDKNYRSSEKTLLKFTESNIFLNLGKAVQPDVYDIANRVKAMIIKKFHGSSTLAEEQCVAEFKAKTGSGDLFKTGASDVLKEVSLWAAAMNITDEQKLRQLLQLVKLKPVDEFRYQEQLRFFFGDEYGE